MSFGAPGHRQGRGIDPRVLEVMGRDVFASDVLSLNGLDDRRQWQGILAEAQELMADAVGADQTFFSTCGSSLSVKSAMLAVAGPGEKLLISRHAHKSVISGVIVTGTWPVWVRPHFDEERAPAPPPEPADVRRALEQHPDARGMLLITPTDWGTCADIRGVADVLVACLEALVSDARDAESREPVALPSTDGLELETLMRPRDAFFAPVEQVPIDRAVGRVAAEKVSPCPPGVPVIAPGERITAEVVDHLSSGVAAGMPIPEAADPQLRSQRVVAE